MGKIKNPFGINSNKEYVYIKTNDYENVEKYKECYCPECGDKLLPRMGAVNVWHFAHERNKECNANFESNLHKYAKEVIKNNNKIKVPWLTVKGYFELDKANKLLIADMQKWDKENVENISREMYLDSSIRNYKWIGAEIKIDDFIPDCVIEIAGKRVAIEIFVTHGVDEVKARKAKESDIDMIEIYLGGIENEMFEEGFDLEKYILEDAIRLWIYKTKIETKDKEIYERVYNTKHYVVNTKYTRPELIEERKLEIQRKLQEDVERRRKELIKEEKRKYALEHKEENEKIKRGKIKDIVEKYRLKKQSEEINICNIPVKGEYAFDCTRNVWQNKIYDKFILRREGKTIQLGRIISWVEKWSDLPYYNEFETYGKIEIWNSKYDAIKEYIIELEQCGVLIILDERFTIWAEAKIINSNKQIATENLLKNKNKKPNNRIKFCTRCGAILEGVDDINAFYIKNFDVDKECFEELLKV